MKKYTDKDGLKVVEVGDISYLSDRNHPYNWFQRHFHHHRLRIALKTADKVIVSDAKTAFDVVRFYFVPKDRITVRP
ncbi:MAG: hypothetical protein IKZ08_02120 [Bacteroidales bacterium]|nr:hypothetical protein [Bacteroidales bacterium]